VFTSSSPTAKYTQLQPSDPSNYLRFDYYDQQSGLALLSVRYVDVKTTQFTEARISAFLPTNFIDWLAPQEHVIKEYPYIKNCWLGPKGEGQPTVHVPVMALTTTISTFLESPEILTAESFEKAPASSLSTKSTIHTIVTVRTSKASSDTSTTTSSETKKPSSQVASPESTEKSHSEAGKLDSDAADADFTSAAKSETAERSQTSEVEEASPALVSGSKQNDTPKGHSATSAHQGLKSNSVYPVEPATITNTVCCGSTRRRVANRVQLQRQSACH
jgi:hypothetical protein